jgi:hypothetical protein
LAFAFLGAFFAGFLAEVLAFLPTFFFARNAPSDAHAQALASRFHADWVVEEVRCEGDDSRQQVSREMLRRNLTDDVSPTCPKSFQIKIAQLRDLIFD